MQAPGSQTFFRGTDRILGGVCSGLAEGFHVETLWVRLAFVVLGFINGVGVLLYVVLGVLMPERAGYRATGQNAFESMGADIKRAWADVKNQFGSGPSTPAAPASAAGAAPAAPGASAAVAAEVTPTPPAAPQPVTRNPTFIFGAILVVLGIAFLAANSGITWDVILPSALIALGVVLLVRNLQKRT